MAFTNTHMRSASFGIVTSLPDDVIDSFWYIIDHFLKNVFELEEELEFQLLNNQGKITFHFSSQHLPTAIDFDFNHPFDPDVYKRQFFIEFLVLFSGYWLFLQFNIFVVVRISLMTNKWEWRCV